jgi:DNA-binding CsgD family transcriptional regulator
MANMYTYSPPFTEQELHECYVRDGMSQTEIARRFGTTQKVVWRAMKKMGIPSRPAKARNQHGEANNNWRGGRVLSARTAARPMITDGGYWYVFRPSHPNATKAGYVAEHIAVATDAAGRSLQPGECVHHIDLDKRNNAAQNLAIGDRKRHGLWHNQLEEIAVSFMREGLVAFDLEHGYRRVQVKPPDAREERAEGGFRRGGAARGRRGHESP